MTESIEVRVGQIWADNDPRSSGRRFRIIEVGDGWARGEILSVQRNVSQHLVGRQTRQLNLNRFRAVRRGYRLVENPVTGTTVSS
jgi:hypothetical protein